MQLIAAMFQENRNHALDIDAANHRDADDEFRAYGALTMRCQTVEWHMKTRTKVVVIGGGIAGCSTLYHLTREGWTDVVLIERDELTSGTTWHSARRSPISV
jgi:heterodisulfide reductase subunit A-like polyferredoxin